MCSCRNEISCEHSVIHLQAHTQRSLSDKPIHYKEAHTKSIFCDLKMAQYRGILYFLAIPTIERDLARRDHSAHICPTPSLPTSSVTCTSIIHLLCQKELDVYLYCPESRENVLYNSLAWHRCDARQSTYICDSVIDIQCNLKGTKI
jgi:hypothetical protein